MKNNYQGSYPPYQPYKPQNLNPELAERVGKEPLVYSKYEQTVEKSGSGLDNKYQAPQIEKQANTYYQKYNITYTADPQTSGAHPNYSGYQSTTSTYVPYKSYPTNQTGSSSTAINSNTNGNHVAIPLNNILGLSQLSKIDHVESTPTPQSSIPLTDSDANTARHLKVQEVELGFDEQRLDVLSHRIEECLMSSRNTLQKTFKLLAERNHPLKDSLLPYSNVQKLDNNDNNTKNIKPLTNDGLLISDTKNTTHKSPRSEAPKKQNGSENDQKSKEKHESSSSSKSKIGSPGTKGKFGLTSPSARPGSVPQKKSPLRKSVEANSSSSRGKDNSQIKLKEGSIDMTKEAFLGKKKNLSISSPSKAIISSNNKSSPTKKFGTPNSTRSPSKKTLLRDSVPSHQIALNKWVNYGKEGGELDCDFYSKSFKAESDNAALNEDLSALRSQSDHYHTYDQSTYGQGKAKTKIGENIKLQSKADQSPDSVDELYTRLFEQETTKYRDNNKYENSQSKAEQDILREKPSQGINSQNKKGSREAWLNQMEEDVKRRQQRSKERTKLKEDLEVEKFQDPHKNKKRNPFKSGLLRIFQVSPERQSRLVDRMWSDVARRQTSNDQLRQIQLEQEAYQAIVNSNTVFSSSPNRKAKSKVKEYIENSNQPSINENKTSERSSPSRGSTKRIRNQDNQREIPGATTYGGVEAEERSRSLKVVPMKPVSQSQIPSSMQEQRMMLPDNTNDNSSTEYAPITKHKDNSGDKNESKVPKKYRDVQSKVVQMIESPSKGRTVSKSSSTQNYSTVQDRKAIDYANNLMQSFKNKSIFDRY